MIFPETADLGHEKRREGGRGRNYMLCAGFASTQHVAFSLLFTRPLLFSIAIARRICVVEY